MLRVVATHGRDAAFDIPQTEQRAWSDALHFGLQRVGAAYAQDLTIAFAFYGDLWRPDTPGGVARRGPDGASETPTELQEDVAREILSAAGASPRATRLRWSDVTALAATLDERTHIGELILRQFLHDLAQYFSEDAVRRQTIDRVADSVRAVGEDMVLLAHSMGTIVGYDLLVRYPDLPVRTFITFGSPLGLASVRPYMRDAAGATPFPPKLERWFNLYNPEDFVAAVRHLAPLYPSDDGRRVEDLEVSGRPPNLTNVLAGHDLRIYLSSMPMGEVLRRVLEGD